MAKAIYVSKVFAVITVTLTVSAIAGIITMMIVYEAQIAGMDPTPRPTTLPPTTLPTGPPPDMRLPGNLVPKSYKLFLQPHLYPSLNMSDVNATDQINVFTGNSTVFFQCVEKTKTIILHNKNLTLLGLIVTDGDSGKLLPFVKYLQYDDWTDFLEIQMSDALAEGGNYSLFVDFQGEMAEDLEGLYVSTYNEDGLKKFIASTQMEPTSARKVFPCFDEPAMKATFDVTIIHRQPTIALGNWPKSGSRLIDDDWSATTFFATKLMSTYLLAFSVSEFPYTENPKPNVNGVKIKTYARKELIEAGHAVYATNIADKLLNYYVKLFNITYPLQKLDQFVVPEHRAAAMENWGLIMYDESAVLFDSKTSGQRQKEWIVEIVAHELAHQWFGNLVTMRWWNDIWLNEGFATYMANLGLAQEEPTWNMKQMNEMRQRQNAFEVDALNSSYPLSSPAVDIQDPGQIDEMFSSISYLKGGAVLRMLEDFMTESSFQKGIKMYLKEFQYNSVETDDLWEYMQKAYEGDNGVYDIPEVMNTWTQQIGYPIITINTSNGEVYQKQFTQDLSIESGQVWQIPIRVMSETANPSFVLLTDGNPVRMENFISNGGKWILANVNATGYYRVNYDPENWKRLMDQLESNPNAIPLMNRGQLIDDAFHLTRAKMVNVTLGLNTTRFLQNDTACLPWSTAIQNLNYFVEMFDRSLVYGPMQAYMRKLVTPLYMHFQDYTDNSTIPIELYQQQNQLNAINVACSNGLPECEIMAVKMFRNWMKNETYNSIHPNLRPAIYCQALAAGGDMEWDFAWRKYQEYTISPDKHLIAHALSCTKKIWLLNRLLEYTLDPEKIRKADVFETIMNVGANAVGQGLAWNFIRAHWETFHEERRMGVSIALREVTKRFSTDFELQELRQFQVLQNATSNMLMNQAIEQTQANNQWVKENKQTVLEWFLAETGSEEWYST
ncbi:alanyl (membrane) aminopeptidase-like b [Gadus macrocephalus]|uniref:alanyl (membrane) aminopeptidase-like b n=1 Tax=Gadus macrocephalus TaxID=80720 RepID=UPI0028CB8987|nr:alanyl (membrane) aminopeptidase-like b [Gadus macrocephalus]